MVKIAESQLNSKENSKKNSNAIEKVEKLHENEAAKYLRVGTEYYKIQSIPTLSGNDTIKKLTKWKRSTMIEDFGKNFPNKIKRFEGFVSVPNHIDYQEEINGFYNQYEPLNYQPKEGNCSETLDFLNHIFGEQIDLGLDYLTLLYLKPTQILPILCLVSQERNTGKTTFLKWLKEIFNGNMTYNKNEDFRSQFNSDLEGKLIIAIDEALLDKKEDSERIKNLSTANNFKSEAKGVDKREVPFFGKFIICSNNENSFVKIDKQEIRYWVRQIPTLEKDNPFLLDKVLYPEIPQFLNYLINRTLTTSNVSRMWFSPEQIRTKAFEKLIKGNRTYIEEMLEDMIREYLDEIDRKEAYLTLNNLFDMANENKIRMNRMEIRRVLQDKWNMKPNEPRYYDYQQVIKKYNADSDEYVISTKTIRLMGRCYYFNFENSTTKEFSKDEKEN
jgi:hypothetical protein